LVEVIDAAGVEAAGPPLDAVHRIALLQQQLGQIGAVLAGNAGDQGCFSHELVKVVESERRALNAFRCGD
jgi:hypothetical protein